MAHCSSRVAAICHAQPASAWPQVAPAAGRRSRGAAAARRAARTLAAAGGGGGAEGPPAGDAGEDLEPPPQLMGDWRAFRAKLVADEGERVPGVPGCEHWPAAAVETRRRFTPSLRRPSTCAGAGGWAARVARQNQALLEIQVGSFLVNLPPLPCLSRRCCPATCSRAAPACVAPSPQPSEPALFRRRRTRPWLGRTAGRTPPARRRLAACCWPAP